MDCCPLDGARLEPLPAEPLLGESIDGYSIESALGDSSRGRVYLGRAADGRTCLVRVLFGEQAASPLHRRRLEREATIASELSHPNIARVLGTGTTSTGLPYLMTEMIDGQTLQEAIERDAPLSRERTVSLFGDILRALVHVHGQGVVHRDLQPSNILVCEREGRELAVLSGFGNAIRADSGSARGLDPPEKVVGSTAHAAPERLERKLIDHRADLFSAGVILYQMLCGRLPFDGTHLVIATQNIACEPPAIAERVPGLTADWRLEATAFRLMQRNPARRFETAKQVLAHLDTIWHVQ